MQHGSVKEVDAALITITHTIGCIALEIARRVADGLQVEVYDDSRQRGGPSHGASLRPTQGLSGESTEMDLRHSGMRVEMPQKGVAHISGVLFNHEDKGRIPVVVGKIPGVEKVQLDVTVVPAGCN